MPSVYLQPSDYASYGVPNATEAQVSSASTLIDAYLRRPEGLEWSPDATGAPAWMTALTPRMTLVGPSGISPGASVVVPVTGGVVALAVGDVLIADRLSSGAAEPVVVAGIDPVNSKITLQNVQFAHSAGVKLDLGLQIKQHKYMPDGRPITRLAMTPVVRLLSGQGRYGYGRRGAAARYAVDEFNLLASLSHFGGPPAWEQFPLTNTGIDPESGQVWVPAGVMLSYYSEVNLWYVAGFQQGNLPDCIKFACAQLVSAIANVGTVMAGNVKSYKAGDTQITLFASSMISTDTRAQIDLYRAKLYA